MKDSDEVASVLKRPPKDHVVLAVGLGSGPGFWDWEREVGVSGGDLGESGGVGSSANTDLKKFIGGRNQRKGIINWGKRP